MTVAVAQLGARMHYGVPRLLFAEDQLEYLYTDICSVKGWPRVLDFVPSVILPGGLRRLRGRIPVGIPPEKIIAFTRFGYEYALKRNKAATTSESMSVHLWAGERFNELITEYGFGAASAVYGFNSASEGLLQVAGSSGLVGIVEQTIAPILSEVAILNEDAAAFSRWGAVLEHENVDLFAAREQREWELADRIVVASDFVKREIAARGGPADKCCVIPYGVDRDYFVQTRKVPRTTNEHPSLRVLFVGTVSLRKGFHYLLEAMGKLDQVAITCRIVGGIQVDKNILGSLTPANVEFIGTVPRNAILKEYASADVFCLPSLCEGSATVIYEALAAGLPVVTTPNSGSIVRDGVEGFVVPIRDSEALADRLECLARDRQLLQSMSQAAYTRSDYGSLEAYGKRLLQALDFG